MFLCCCSYLRMFQKTLSRKYGCLLLLLLPATPETDNFINAERLAYWQSMGAQLSPTAARLVKRVTAKKPAKAKHDHEGHDHKDEEKA